MLFSEEYSALSPEEMAETLAERIRVANIPRMVVTLGGSGAAYAELDGAHGVCPSIKVDVVDTTGCGDAFFSGVVIGLTYGKDLAEACLIGTRLATSVIATRENVSPRFLPAELGIDFPALP